MAPTSLSSVVSLAPSGCVSEPSAPLASQLAQRMPQVIELRVGLALKAPSMLVHPSGAIIVLAADPTRLGTNACLGIGWECVSFSATGVNSPLLFSTDAASLLGFR